MDPLKNSPASRQEDSDLGIILEKSSRATKALFKWIGQGISRFLNLIGNIILLLFRNIIWIIAFTLLGLGYGAYRSHKMGLMYFAEMTVKSNFNSTRTLYSTIDYFNALTGSGQHQTLAEVFRISKEEASQLVSFDIVPIKSEISASELYKQNFLEQYRSQRHRQDTFWTRTIGYREFKKSLTDHDYPFQTITVVANNPNLFPKLEDGIVREVSENTVLQKSREKQISNNRSEEQAILNSLRMLDTLKNTYNQRLLKEGSGLPSNNLTVLQNPREYRSSPELEVYDKTLEMLDELKLSRQRSVTENEILEIYSRFNAAGQQVSLFKQQAVKYTLLGFYLSTGIVLIAGLYKFLSLREQERRKKLLNIP